MSPRRRSGFLAPFLTALGVFALLHVYVAQRLFVAPALPAVLAVGGCVLLALRWWSWFRWASSSAGRTAGGRAAVFPPLAIGWLGVSGVLLTVTVVTDLGRLLYGLLHGWPDAAAALHQARLQAVAIALGTAVLVPFAIWTARGRLVLSRVRVPLEKLAPGVAGLRIVQISDLHIGARIGEAFLRRVVDRVNALRPDVVAITGDLVDGPVHLVEQALRPLADLDAPHGVYFVTGNHEYYWDGRESVRMVKALGLTVLHNEHRVVERAGGAVVIGGIPDLHGGRFLADHESRPDLVFAGAPEGAPRVLLAHQPRAVIRRRGARGGSPARRPHPWRADLPVPSLRPAPAAGRPGAPQAARRLGVRAPRHRVLGPADAPVLHAGDRRNHPDSGRLSGCARPR